MKTFVRRIGRGVGGCALVATLCVTGALNAAADSCREWRREHHDWKTETLRRYLNGAPQAELDVALFELLQREAYLTSCETSVELGRADLVGWRLVGRAPDEFGSAVAESVLDRAGFDLELEHLFEPAAPPVATARRASGWAGWRRGVAGGAR